MKLKIDDTSILVTGASSGIGLELAKQFAPRAKKLILVARREDRLLQLKQELQKRFPRLEVLVLPCDLADQKQIDEMLTKAGDVDILVNNAGFGDIGYFASSDWTKINQMIQVNVTALTYLTRRLIGPMMERGRGGVMMVSSSSAFQTLPGFGAYSATKYYVDGLTEALRAEVVHSGVVITQLCPGPVATEFTDVAKREYEFLAPKFLRISAEKCARNGIRAFEKGKTLHIPALRQRLMVLSAEIVPRCVFRWIMARLAYHYRAQFA